MLALDFLRVAFAWAVLVGVQMPGVGPPIIGMIAAQPEGLQQRFEPQNDHISSISASASPARSRSQATSAGFSVRSKVVFTNSSVVSFFLSSRSTVLGQICNERAVSRTPLALRLMSMIMCLTSGKHPRLQ